MGGLTTPKGGDTRTTTTTNTAPQYITDANQNLVNTAQSTLGSYITQPAYTSAGINSDQSGAYDLTRYLAQGSFTGKPITVPANTNTAMAPGASTYGAMSAAPNFYTGASTGPVTNANAAQVGGNDFQQFMNPYIQSVIDPAVANLRNQSNINAAQIGAQSAAAGSFGGSREALRQGQNTRALGEQTSSLVSQLMSAGYDKATSMAMANAQMRQQAELQNASAANSAAQFNASSQNQANQSNVNSANVANQFNAAANNTANQTNTAAQNSRDQFLASLGLQGRAQDLSAAQIQDGLASSDFSRKQAAINALLGIGNAQQTTVQNNLNVPLQYLQLLAGITPKDNSGTATQVAPNTANSPFMNLLGLGTSILGMGTGGGSTVLGGLLK